MLCIFAFVVFLILFPILGFFPSYRRLFRRSWQCVFNRVTFRPCDINLGEELKAAFLGSFIFKYPRLAKFLDKTFTFWAFLFVVINVWSLVVVINSGVNLLVYDTCDPVSGEACSLSGEACGIAANTLDFSTAWNQNRVAEWAAQPFTQFGDTVSKIPNRFKTWNAEDYQSQTATYYEGKRTNKPLALEVIDPSCVSCKKLFANLKSANFKDKYDITYIAYPIPSSTSGTGYKFPYSYMIAGYLEAMKTIQPQQVKNSTQPTDWQLLEIIWTRSGNTTQTLQDDFNYAFTKAQAEQKLEDLLIEIGYSKQQVSEIKNKATTDEIQTILKNNRATVEQKIQTIKIPTFMYGGRRYDRVVDVDYLQK